MPASTWTSPASTLSTQCAAVSTQREWTREPPQNCRKPDPSGSISATCHGHSPESASTPPTIRVCCSEAARPVASSAGAGAPQASSAQTGRERMMEAGMGGVSTFFIAPFSMFEPGPGKPSSKTGFPFTVEGTGK